MRAFTSALSAVALSAIVLYLCDIKYGIKIKRVFAYLPAALTGALCFLVEFIFGFQYTSVALFLGFVLFSLFSCKAKWSSALLSGIFVSTALLLSQLCSIMIISAVFNIRLHQLDSSAFLNVSTTVFSLILFLLAVYVILRFTDKSDRYSSVSFALLAMPAASLLTTIVITKMYFSYKLNDEIALWVSALNLFLLISNIVVFYIHDNAVKSRRYADQIKNEYQLWKNRDEYYTKLEEQNKGSRVLMHDIKKHLGTIGNISSGKAADYISEISDDYNVSNPIDYCKDATLNLITHRFYEKCKANGIRFDVNIREIKLDFMTAPDITALFDNLLENAFESAITSDEKQIDFTAYLRNQNFIIIRLTNSCDIRPTYKNGELLTNKKSPFHGIGTKSIKRVVKKYDGDNDMKFNEDEGTFESVIMLRTSKEV